VNDLGGSADGRGGSSSMADATVKEINEAGGKAVANYDSVSTPEGGKAIIQTALDNFGKVDILVNNAGILRDKSFLKLEPQDLDAILDVHLRGAFFVTQPAFASMKENGYGRIVIASSARGIFGNFGQSNYGAAKMGLVGLMNVLAVEGAKNNIKVNTIAPIAKTRSDRAAAGRSRRCARPDVRDTARHLSLLGEVRAHPRDLRRGRRTLCADLRRHDERLDRAEGQKPSADDIFDQIDVIRDAKSYTIPSSIADETKAIAEALKSQQ
jgi:NAD(P)-dependent dehydrogenase (short-subunit alcohol dehydrogenase family)